MATSHLNNLTRWIYYPWNWKENNSKSYNKILSDINNINGNSNNLEGIALINEDLFEDISLTGLLVNNEDFVSEENANQEVRIRKLIGAAGNRNLKMEIMPELDNNKKLINAFNNPLSLSRMIELDDVPVIWSANQFQTWRVDEGDLAFYSEFYKGSKVFLDLTLYPRSGKLQFFATDSIWPYKLQMASLFEPFSNEVVPGVYSQVEKTIIGFELVSVFDKIRLQTASDYFWNPGGYNPDLSLYRALVSEYGEQLTQDLIYFNDYYFKLKLEFILAKQLKNINKHQRKIAAYLKEIELLKNKIQIVAEASNHIELADTINNLLEELMGDIHIVYPVLSTE